MDSYFVISVQNVNGKEQFLNFDDGYPYYSDYTPHRYVEYDKAMQTIDNMKINIKKQSGEYYKSNLNFKTLKIVEIGEINSTLIDIEEPTQEEQIFNSLDKILSKKDYEKLLSLGVDKIKEHIKS